MAILQEANTVAHGNRYAPKCLACERRMRKDDFNGMWVCHDSNHGGYQTESQVAALIEKEIYLERGLMP